MKNSFIFAAMAACCIALPLQAENSELYLGLDLFGAGNDFSFDVSGTGSGSGSTDVDSSGFKLKFGTLQNYGLRLQGYLQYEKFDETIFDATNDKLYEIGLDLIKGFEATPELTPFLQAGIGYGWMAIDSNYYDRSTIDEVCLKIGGGVMYRLTPVFEVTGGIDFNFRRWADIEIKADPYRYTIETSDSGPRYYIGANFHF